MSLSLSLGKIALNIAVNSTEYTQGLNSALQGARRFANIAQSGLGKSLNSTSALAKKAGIAMASAFGVAKIVSFSNKCIELGSDLEEVQNVVNVSFPQMTEQIDEFSKSAAKNFGLSETMAKKYVGTFGSMAKAFGYNESEAANMSKTLTGLAGDVASFYNLSQDESYTKLKSVFTGETESLKELGVVMTQTALDEFALANGFEKTTKKMTEKEKVALRYAFVQKQLTSATGDFSRTSEGWANQTRILNLQIESLKANLGQGLINVLNPVLKSLNNMLGSVTLLTEKFKEFTEELFGSSGGNETSMSGVSVDAGNVAENITAADEAAQQFKKTISGFDEINKISGDADSGNQGIGNGTSTKVTIKPDITTDDSEKTTIGLVEKLKNTVKSGDFTAIGETVGNMINRSLYYLDWSKYQGGFNKVAKSIYTGINGFIKTVEWESVGSTVAKDINTVLNSENIFGKNISWTGFGDAISRSVNGFIRTFKFRDAGDTWSTFNTGVKDTCIAALEGIEWHDFGIKIGYGLNAIKWEEVFEKDFTMAADLVNAIASFSGGIAKEFDFSEFGKSFANGINKFFEKTNFKKLGCSLSSIGKGIFDAITSAVLNVNTDAIADAIVGLITGIDVAGLLKGAIRLNAAMFILPAKAAVSITKSISKSIANEITVSDFSDIDVALSEKIGGVIGASDGLKESFKNSTSEIKGQFETIRDVAREYVELSSKYNSLTDEQKKLLEGYSTILKDNVNGVEQYIDPITNAYKGTKDQLDELIDKTESYYITMASQDALVETGKKLVELKKQYSEVYEAFQQGNQFGNGYGLDTEQILNEWEYIQRSVSGTKYEAAIKQLMNVGFDESKLSSSNKKLINEYKNFNENFAALFMDSLSLNGYLPIDLIALDNQILKTTEDMQYYKEAIETNGKSLTYYNNNSVGPATAGTQSFWQQVNKTNSGLINFSGQNGPLNNSILAMQNFGTTATTVGKIATTNLSNGINSQESKTKVQVAATGVIGIITRIFSGSNQTIKSSGSNVSINFSNGIGANNNYAKQCASGLATTITGLLGGVYKTTKESGKSASVNFGNGVGGNNLYAKQCTNGLANTVTGILGGVFKTTKQNGQTASVNFGNGVGGNNNYVKLCTQGMANNVFTVTNAMPATMKTHANNCITGFTEPFSKDTSVATKLSNWAALGLGAVKKMLGIASPSKEMKKIGKFTIEGFNDGIKENQDKTSDAMSKWTKEITDVNVDKWSDDFVENMKIVAKSISDVCGRICQINAIDMSRITPELKATTIRYDMTSNRADEPDKGYDLLRQILKAIKELDIDVELDGESIKKDTVRRINNQTKASGVCEIIT